MSVLDELERLENAATPGEWSLEGEITVIADDEDGFKPWFVCEATSDCGYERDHAGDNAALIAASRNALPALLRLARVAEQAVKDLNYSSGSTIKDDACCARDILSAALRDLGVEV